MTSLHMESSLNDLYRGAVNGFPTTTRRQHAIDTVRIVELSWTPYVGLRTLFIKGVAQNFDSTPYSEYKVIALFKGVTYGSGIPVAVNGIQYLIEQLSAENDGVLVKCSCGDYNWRFRHYNFLDKSNYGRDRKKYEGAGLWKANPLEMPGMCKHIMKMMLALRDAKMLN